MRGLGYRPDLPKLAHQRRDIDFSETPMLSATPLPPAVNRRDLIVDILDQGDLGSCVANAGFQAIRASHVRQGVANPVLGSRLWGYYLARAAHHETQIDGGTYLRSFFEVLNKLGFPPEEVWPYSDSKLPAMLRIDWLELQEGDAPFTQMPSTEAFDQAIDQRAPTIYRRISSEGYERVLDVKRAIANGYLPVFGCRVGQSFVTGEFNPALPLSPPRADDVGGHAMLAVGYDGDRFEICNSWGEGFGIDGYVLHSADYVVEWQDIWTVEHAPIEGEE